MVSRRPADRVRLSPEAATIEVAPEIPRPVGPRSRCPRPRAWYVTVTQDYCPVNSYRDAVPGPVVRKKSVSLNQELPPQAGAESVTSPTSL